MGFKSDIWDFPSFFRVLFAEFADSLIHQTAFLARAEPELLLPSSISTPLQLSLRKICSLSAHRQHVEQAFLIHGQKVVSHFSR